MQYPTSNAPFQHYLGSSVLAFFFAASLFGYPLISVFITLFDLDSRSLSVPFRAFIALLSLFIFLKYIRKLRVNPLRFALLAVMVVYGSRLIHDYLFMDIAKAEYNLHFFIAACLLPSIALMAAEGHLASRDIVLFSFGICATTCFAVVCISVLGLSSQQQLTELTGRLSFVSLNPITLGYLASSALLSALVLWKHTLIQYRLWIILGIGLAFYCLLLSASKGPVFALLFVVSLWLLKQRRLLEFSLLAFIVLFITVSAGENATLAMRIATIADDTSTLDRLILIQNSLAQIQSSPLFGSAHVELTSGYYPHNIFLEACLAFGIPLAILFSIILVLTAITAWHLLDNHEYQLISLFFFQSVFSAFLSDALFGASMLWVSTALLLAKPTLRFLSI